MTKEYRDDYVPSRWQHKAAAEDDDAPDYLNAELSLSGNLSFRTARFPTTDGVYDDDMEDEFGDDVD